MEFAHTTDVGQVPYLAMVLVHNKVKHTNTIIIPSIYITTIYIFNNYT
ncbi:hypothetical protein HanXRQr2_Chr12g0550011 [Helianthus annuus]|uniref:Uncharacterized protein n=1 Tax=Helianthus annuus TaxID=4232 RepID=A0A9K3MWT1_HELAN|nr:hypothetical protein HanXRQr2_Chr12g0550011 [Helianthus annuus]